MDLITVGNVTSTPSQDRNPAGKAEQHVTLDAVCVLSVCLTCKQRFGR